MVNAPAPSVTANAVGPPAAVLRAARRRAAGLHRHAGQHETGRVGNRSVDDTVLGLDGARDASAVGLDCAGRQQRGQHGENDPRQHPARVVRRGRVLCHGVRVGVHDVQDFRGKEDAAGIAAADGTKGNLIHRIAAGALILAFGHGAQWTISCRYHRKRSGPGLVFTSMSPSRKRSGPGRDSMSPSARRS